MTEGALERIAAALERLAPPPPAPTDWLTAPAYVWEGERARPVPVLDALPLEALHGIASQKVALRDNCARLASGAAAHDTLLWGARGMGKSALVRACVADVQREAPRALALVQLAPGALPTFPALIAELAGQPRAFLLFIDDLGFGADGRAEMLGTLAGWLPADLTGQRVLDAGCGTGLLAVELANRGADVVAIDLSPTLVGLAAERAAGRFSRGTIDWRAGDMLDPALGDFDHVVAMDSLIHYQPWDMVNAYAALAPRTRRSMLVTHAPWTPVLGSLQAIGRLFPQSDRAPRIVPVHAGLLRVEVTKDRRLAGWGLGRTRRVSRGFYKSQALELVRRGGAGA